MSDHSSFQATAAKLLKKNGRPVTLMLKVNASGLAKPWEPGAPQYQQANVVALFFPTTLKDDKGTVIPGIFHQCYFAYTDAVEGYADWIETNAPSLDGAAFPKLTTADKIIDAVEGREYQIVRIKELKPGEQSILFDMIVSG